MNEMMIYPVRQFKLATGEEILIEVVQELGDGEYTDTIIARRAVQVDVIPTDTGNQRQYIMKPWFLYGDDGLSTCAIACAHVVAHMDPSVSLVTQYYETVRSMIEINKSRKPGDDLQLAMALLAVQQATCGDSDMPVPDAPVGNVVSFPPKK